MDNPAGKLARAKKHAATIRDELACLKETDEHTITVEDDPDSCQYVFTIHNLRQPRPDLPYIVGDCLHNLRSALDHLAYQLAILGQGRALSADEAKSTGFPIEVDSAKALRPGTGRLKLLRLGEQTRIIELQPYNARDPSVWGPTWSGPTAAPGRPTVITPDRQLRAGSALPPLYLEQLAELDNIDKHRAITAVWRSLDYSTIPFRPEGITGEFSTGGALKDDAELCRWSYDLPRPELAANMDMDRHFPIGIRLADVFTLDSAEEFLDNLIACVEGIVQIFRPCIETGAPPSPVVQP